MYKSLRSILKRDSHVFHLSVQAGVKFVIERGVWVTVAALAGVRFLQAADADQLATVPKPRQRSHSPLPRLRLAPLPPAGAKSRYIHAPGFADPGRVRNPTCPHRFEKRTNIWLFLGHPGRGGQALQVRCLLCIV